MVWRTSISFLFAFAIGFGSAAAQDLHRQGWREFPREVMLLKDFV